MSSSIILTKEYFKRYGEHLSDCGNCKEAWKRTEMDLFRETGVCRRYTTYQSFAVALSRFKRGEHGSTVVLKVMKF